MENRIKLHLVVSSSRARAEQARTCFELGYHCEVYADSAELLDRPPRDGIVIVDDASCFGGAAGVLSEIAERGLWLPVIAVSHDPRPGRVVDAIRAGALDYLHLPLQSERLNRAVSRINAEAPAHAEARRRVIEARSRIATLTPREQEVLTWLANGRSNKMIARKLSISPRTVEIHRANLMQKLGARHAAHAVRLQIEANAGALSGSSTSLARDGGLRQPIAEGPTAG